MRACRTACPEARRPRDDVLGGEAAIDAQQAIEAEQKHASENNEGDAGGDFADDERAAHLLAAGGFRRGAAFRTQRLLRDDCGRSGWRASRPQSNAQTSDAPTAKRTSGASIRSGCSSGRVEGRAWASKGRASVASGEAEEASAGREQERLCNRAAHQLRGACAHRRSARRLRARGWRRGPAADW